MNWDEFISTVVINEYLEAIELDLRPFGARQSEALDCWIEAALKGGDPFGKTYVVKTHASMVLSQSTRENLANLQQRGVSVSLIDPQ
ncbi:MAG: hypothetical protein ACRD3P_01045 [Terriglobales bacterium]